MRRRARAESDERQHRERPGRRLDQGIACRDRGAAGAAAGAEEEPGEEGNVVTPRDRCTAARAARCRPQHRFVLGEAVDADVEETPDAGAEREGEAQHEPAAVLGAPVVSPTLIIWHTMGGKTLLSMSGSAIVCPLEMLCRAFMMACSTTLLPAVRAVMVSASRMGTPEETSVPRVRVKRATADFRMRGPKIGTRSRARSIATWPCSVL